MSKAEVISILGRPSSVTAGKGQAEDWFYSRGTFCMVEVQFTERGLVHETVHDH